MTDSLIEQWVLQHLALLNLAGCREVCVLAQKGIVTLDGTVPSRTAGLAIQEAALAAKGVIAVVNNLQWQPAEVAVPRYASASAAKAARGVSLAISASGAGTRRAATP